MTTLASVERSLGEGGAGLLIVFDSGVPRVHAELLGQLAETHGRRETVVVSMEGAASHARAFRERLGHVLVLSHEVEGSSSLVPVSGWSSGELLGSMIDPQIPIRERTYLVPGDARGADVERWNQGLPGFVLAVQESLAPDKKLRIYVQGLFLVLDMEPLAPSAISLNPEGSAGTVIIRGRTWFLGAGLVRRPGRGAGENAPYEVQLYIGCLQTPGQNSPRSKACTVTWLVSLPGGRHGLLQWQADSVEESGELVRALPLLKRSIEEMKYARGDNFLGTAVYPPDAQCYLTPSSALALTAAEKELADSVLGGGFVLWDCYRPKQVQREMWDLKPDPRYVAPPRGRWSAHNRGTAVDLSVLDRDGQLLPGPTEHDDFSERAAGAAVAGSRAAETRDRLRAAMTRSGWTPLRTEWWHFEGPDAATSPPLELAFPETAERTEQPSQSGQQAISKHHPGDLPDHER